MKVNHAISNKQRRAARVRKAVRGTSERPRVTVHRSNQTTYIQVIDDAAGKTLVAAGAKMVKLDSKLTKLAEAIELAKIIVTQSKKKGIKKMVFDRGPYRYHGRVKAVADTLRENGIEI